MQCSSIYHSSPQSPSEPQPSSPSASPSTAESEAENFVVVDVVAFFSSSAIWVAIQIERTWATVGNVVNRYYGTQSRWIFK